MSILAFGSNKSRTTDGLNKTATLDRLRVFDGCRIWCVLVGLLRKADIFPPLRVASIGRIVDFKKVR